MDGTQVGLLKHPDHKGLGGLLEGVDRRFGPPVAGLDLQGELPRQPRERGLGDECVGALLVLSDFAQGERAGRVAVAGPTPEQGLACCLGAPFPLHLNGPSCFAQRR